jgi:hypothetical protein
MGMLAHDTVYGGDSSRPSWVENARSYQFMNACSAAMTKIVNDRRNAGKPAPRY